MINTALENLNLIGLHSLLCLFGSVMAIVVMQMTSHLDDEVGEDPLLIIYLRRVTMWALSGSLLWAWSYSLTKGWQPWPAYVALILALDVMLLMRAMTLKVRIRNVHARKVAEGRGQPIPVGTVR